MILLHSTNAHNYFLRFKNPSNIPYINKRWLNKDYCNFIFLDVAHYNYGYFHRLEYEADKINYDIAIEKAKKLLILL